MALEEPPVEITVGFVFAEPPLEVDPPETRTEFWLVEEELDWAPAEFVFEDITVGLLLLDITVGFEFVEITIGFEVEDPVFVLEDPELLFELVFMYRLEGWLLVEITVGPLVVVV